MGDIPNIEEFVMRNGRQRILDQIARNILSVEEAGFLVKSFDVIGDVAILKFPNSLEIKRIKIGKALLKAVPKIKVILQQKSAVSGDFRTRKLEWLAGEKRVETIYREHGCSFKLNLAKVYFSPRLSSERMRIAELVREGEVIVNMFAGVGCFSLIIAKHSQAEKIYSIDINPNAVSFMRENIDLAKVWNRVIPIKGDAKTVIETELKGKADRVLMPLPQKAYEYLDAAVTALKPSGGWVHYYDFTHAEKGEDPVEKVSAKVSGKIGDLTINFNIPFGRIVRSTGPNWYQVALDIRIKSRIP